MAMWLKKRFVRKKWYSLRYSNYLITQREKVESFVALTNGTKEQAYKMLEDSDWDLLVT